MNVGAFRIWIARFAVGPTESNGAAGSRARLCLHMCCLEPQLSALARVKGPGRRLAQTCDRFLRSHRTPNFTNRVELKRAVYVIERF